MLRSLIVALTPAGVIGRGGALPWRLSADLVRFKQITMGHHLIMGRKTYDSIGKPLPGRTTIVITRQPESLRRTMPPEVLLADSIAAAFQLAASDSETFLIGGGEIFQAALPLVDRLYVTWVDAEVAGDTYFPALDLIAWKLVSEEAIAADAKNEFPTRFCIYDRVSS